MSIANICLALFLICAGINYLAIAAIPAVVLGVLALIAGILFLVDSYHPITIRRP